MDGILKVYFGILNLSKGYPLLYKMLGTEEGLLVLLVGFPEDGPFLRGNVQLAFLLGFVHLLPDFSQARAGCGFPDRATKILGVTFE